MSDLRRTLTTHGAGWGYMMSMQVHEFGALPAKEISEEEGEKIFDETARRKLGISGEEFLRRWDAGKYSNLADENPRAQEVAMLIPLVRTTDAR